MLKCKYNRERKKTFQEEAQECSPTESLSSKLCSLLHAKYCIQYKGPRFGLTNRESFFITGTLLCNTAAEGGQVWGPPFGRIHFPVAMGVFLPLNAIAISVISVQVKDNLEYFNKSYLKYFIVASMTLMGVLVSFSHSKLLENNLWLSLISNMKA